LAQKEGYLQDEVKKLEEINKKLEEKVAKLQNDDRDNQI